jgi:hypothetical protein
MMSEPKSSERRSYVDDVDACGASAAAAAALPERCSSACVARWRSGCSSSTQRCC